MARFRLATTYHGLGCTYYTMGESDKAVGYHEKSLKLLLAAHGPEHPEVGNAYEGMANIYFSDQKLDLALEYYHKALSVTTKVRCPANSSNLMVWVVRDYRGLNRFPMDLMYNKRMLIAGKCAQAPECPSGV